SYAAQDAAAFWRLFGATEMSPRSVFAPPLIGEAYFNPSVSTSSVICFANATFPKGKALKLLRRGFLGREFSSIIFLHFVNHWGRLIL
ncbi:MAG: hypothetical protein J6P94_05385, partial [Oscillospiraceae bacterium]|nr:hypothetical protein [Oscillospiraceae bacterium]